MSGSGKVQRRLEAVKHVFAENPGTRFTLREVLDALCASGYGILFAAEASENKRKPRVKKDDQAAAGHQDVGVSSGKKKRPPRKPKSEARLNEEARLRRVKRCLETLEGKTPASSTGGIEETVPTYLVRSKKMIAGKDELVWSASKVLEEEFQARELDAFSGWAALRAVREILGWVMPEAVQSEVDMYLEEAEEKFSDLKANGYTARWLNSLTLRPATYHYFTAQHVDLRIKEAIEQAIMLNKRVRLTLDPEDEGSPWESSSENVSVYRYVLTLPDTPEILVLPHYEGTDRMGDLSEIVECLRIPLSKIKDAVLLDESADFPPRYHALAKDELGQTDFRLPRQTGEMDVAELRVAPWLMSRWLGTWIYRNMEVIGIDLEGWSVCRLTYPRPRRKLHEWSDFGDDLFYFLSAYASGVEVLSPPHQRRRFKKGAIAGAAMYMDGRRNG